MRSDEELMVAHQRGDPAAFAEIVARYALRLVRLAGSFTRSAEDARDLVQQTFLQLHRARNDYDSRSGLRAWLYTIALNVFREHRRARKNQPLPSLDAAGVPEPAVSAVDPERVEAARRVRAALDALPEDQREVIELHWFQELTFDEASVCLGISTAAARVRAHRGYRRLREVLAGVHVGNQNRRGRIG